MPAECVWIVVVSARRAQHAAKGAGLVVPGRIDGAGGPRDSRGRPAARRRPLVLAVYFFVRQLLVRGGRVRRRTHRPSLQQRLHHAREIGSYELVEPIGEGGMGEVWRAEHRLLARPAAIKLIRRDCSAQIERAREAIVRRFEREAQATATLGSTHTVDVYDFGVTEDGDFYYVMELLNGLSLERFVQRRADGAGACRLSAAPGLSLVG